MHPSVGIHSPRPSLWPYPSPVFPHCPSTVLYLTPQALLRSMPPSTETTLSEQGRHIKHPKGAEQKADMWNSDYRLAAIFFFRDATSSLSNLSRYALAAAK